MKEFMPHTHADPELVRRYADGELSFDDIAEDQGPRLGEAESRSDWERHAQIIRDRDDANIDAMYTGSGRRLGDPVDEGADYFEGDEDPAWAPRRRTRR